MNELSKEETPTQKSGKGGIKLIVLGVIVVIAILIGAIIVLVTKLGNQRASEEPKEKKSVITAETANEVIEEWVQEDEDKYVPQYFTVVQNTTWTFPDGNSPSIDATVSNDADNETPVYFDVVIEETGETIYSSPILELGATVEKFRLDQELSAGTYNATVIYHLVDEEQNELTTVNVGVTITVQN